MFNLVHFSRYKNIAMIDYQKKDSLYKFKEVTPLSEWWCPEDCVHPGLSNAASNQYQSVFWAPRTVSWYLYHGLNHWPEKIASLTSMTRLDRTFNINILSDKTSTKSFPKLLFNKICRGTMIVELLNIGLGLSLAMNIDIIAQIKLYDSD